MKTLLLSLLLCFPVMAQTGFKTEGNNIIWQGVFSTENANILAVLDRDPNLKISNFMDSMYKGQADDVQNTCNGGTGIMKNKIKFDFVILQDPAGYVVKVRNLRIIEKFGPMQAKTIAKRCEKYFMDNGQLNTQPNAAENMACMDSFFSNLFGIQPAVSNTSITSN
ncbi:hypothetical protein [Flavobacterium rivuli]|nr:hypothetical protein [Flavobacterium rivuli]